MMRSNSIAAISLSMIVCVSVGCASGGKPPVSGERGSCSLRAADSALARSGPVYRDCAVDREARLLTSNVRMDFTPSRSNCYAAEIEVVVDAQGVPEMTTARVVRTTDGAFAEAALATLARHRYEPARVNGQPVRQIVMYQPKLTGTVTRVVVTGSGSQPPPPPPRPARGNRPTC